MDIDIITNGEVGFEFQRRTPDSDIEKIDDAKKKGYPWPKLEEYAITASLRDRVANLIRDGLRASRKTPLKGIKDKVKREQALRSGRSETYVIPGLGKLLVRNATQQDIQKIIDLYEKVAVTPDNLFEKIGIPHNAPHPHSFKNEGGMFKCPNAGQLREMIHSKKIIVKVGIVHPDTDREKIIAYYSCHTDAVDFNSLVLQPVPDKKNISIIVKLLTSLGIKDFQPHDKAWLIKFRDAMENVKIVSASMDSIVDPAMNADEIRRFQNKGVMTVVKREVFRDLHSLGKKIVLIEIYEVRSAVETDEQTGERRWLYSNLRSEPRPSVHLHRELGGERIGRIERPRQKIGPAFVKILPHILAINIPEAIERAQKRLERKRKK